MPPAKVLGIFALAAVACGTSWAQGKVLRYGQALSAQKSIYSLPVALAEREGLFRREGLDFRIVIPIPGGADRMIAALHDDTVDVTHVATPFLVRAALAGSDAVAIAAEFNDPIYSLVARPEIARIADLKGRVVAMADPGGSITYSMRKLLALNGVREADVQVKTIDGTPARLNCLRRGECAAVPLGQPQDLVALSEGYRLLAPRTRRCRSISTRSPRRGARGRRRTRTPWCATCARSPPRSRRSATPRSAARWSRRSSRSPASPRPIAERMLDAVLRARQKVLPPPGEIDLKDSRRSSRSWGRRAS